MKKILFCSLVPFLFLVMSSSAFAYFDDVSSSLDVYSDAIRYLEEEGVIHGTSSESGYSLYFYPENEINRAEFVKIVIGAAGYEPSGENCFKDVTDDWYAPFVCKAKELGIIDGYGDGTFKPANTINFAEASKIIVRAFGLDYLDESDVFWYKPYVDSLENVKAIPQSIGSFAYKLKKEDMAEMVYRLMNNITDEWTGSYELIQAIQEYEALQEEDSLKYFIKDLMNDPDNYENILPALAEKYDIEVTASENPDGIDPHTAEEIKIFAAALMHLDYDDYPGPWHDDIYHSSYKDAYFFINSFEGKLFMTDVIDKDTFEFLGLYDYCFEHEDYYLEEHDFETEKEKKDWCDNWYKEIELGSEPFGHVVLAKDKNNVYHVKSDSLVLLEGFDPDIATRNVGGDYDLYIANENDVYYSANYELVLLEGADARSFEHFMGFFYRDEDDLFFFDEGNYAWGNVDDDSMYKVEYANPDSFKFLHLEGFYTYFADDEDIFIFGRYYNSHVALVDLYSENVEIYSFIEDDFIPLYDEATVNPYTEFPEGNIYGLMIVDGEVYVYSYEDYKKIEGLDAETLEVLYDSYFGIDQVFVKDKNGFYFINGYEMEEIYWDDPETFDIYTFLEEHPSRNSELFE